MIINLSHLHFAKLEGVQAKGISLWLGFLLLSTHLLSCSSVSVRTDFDKSANFSALQSYTWTTSPQKNDKNAIEDQQILSQINKAIDRQLNLQGYQLTQENPDFWLASKASVITRSYSSQRSYGRSRPLRLLEGNLIIQIFNPDTRKLIWLGDGKITMGKDDDAEADAKHLQEIVQKILERFPPK